MGILKRYKKKTEAIECVQTGVSIEKRQKEFIEKNELNLSRIVRDALDSLMNNQPILKGTDDETDSDETDL